MSKHTILWADDDIDDLELFQEVLLDLSAAYKVKEFTNGKGVLNHLQGLATDDLPCLIVMDMNMPVMSGRDTLGILKNDPVYSNIPVVILTTSISALDRMYCDRFSTVMLTKPPTYEGIKLIVQTLLDHCLQHS